MCCTLGMIDGIENYFQARKATLGVVSTVDASSCQLEKHADSVPEKLKQSAVLSTPSIICDKSNYHDKVGCTQFQFHWSHISSNLSIGKEEVLHFTRYSRKLWMPVWMVIEAQTCIPTSGQVTLIYMLSRPGRY